MTLSQTLTFFPWVAAAFVVFSCIQAGYLVLLSRRTVRTVGKIIEVEKTKQRTIVTIEYVTQKGKHCRLRVPTLFDADDWRKGKTVALRYEAKRPTSAVLERRVRAGWGRAGALLGLGALLAMVGLVFA